MKKMLMFVATLSVFMVVGVIAIQAQVTDALVADIPFDFIVRDKTLPAGRYTIRRIDEVMGETMMITSSDHKQAIAFLTTSTHADKTPHQGELIFERIGDEYFLSQLYNQENPVGAAVQKSHTEQNMERLGAQAERQTVTIQALNAFNASR